MVIYRTFVITLLNNTYYRVKHNSNDVSKLNVNGYLIEKEREREIASTRNRVRIIMKNNK